MDKEDLEDISQKGIVLVVSESEDYFNVNKEILKLMIEDEGRSGIYVTVNKPYTQILSNLEGSVDTDKIFFVDSASSKSDPDMDNVMFMDSPEDLTGLSIVISEGLEALGDGDKFMLLDSLTTLQIYNEMNTVTKFAHYLTNKLRTHENVSGIILSVDADENQQIISRLSQFCDCVVRI